MSVFARLKSGEIICITDIQSAAPELEDPEFSYIYFRGRKELIPVDASIEEIWQAINEKKMKAESSK
jgi:glutamine phosphoribosylpyrophosphate amidotransferase